MKKILIVIIILIAAYTAYLCVTFEPADTPAPEVIEIDPVGSYLYEGEGMGGSFLISINDDGTYSYTEGPMSSYAGFGEWRLEGDLLYLSDITFSGPSHSNIFRLTEEGLIYISEGSEGYTYIELVDGARFNKK